MKKILAYFLMCITTLYAGFSTSSQNQQTRPPYFWSGVKVGNLSNTLTEISGLTPARRVENSNYIWAIEDGNLPRITAINKNTAVYAGRWTTSFTTVDVEEVDSAVVNGQPYIYAIDCGDNGSSRSTFTILRIKEPIITGSNGTLTTGTDAEQITVQFPASNLPSLKDVEGVFADNFKGDLYFITKRITPILCYRLQHQETYSGTQTLEYLGALSNDVTLNTLSTTVSGNNGYVTGACISPNGTEILICNYRYIFRFTRNLETQSIIQALQTAPSTIETVIGQGNGLRAVQTNSLPQQEAVCFDKSGFDYYTCSEYVTDLGATVNNYPLFKFQRLDRQPTIYSFRDGESSYAGTVDTSLDSNTPTTSQATGTSVVADLDYSAYPTVSRNRQGLLKFDLSAIPANQTVVSAYLEMAIVNEGLGFALHKVLVTWTESSI